MLTCHHTPKDYQTRLCKTSPLPRRPLRTEEPGGCAIPKYIRHSQAPRDISIACRERQAVM
jgi:hypothetical protein